MRDDFREATTAFPRAARAVTTFPVPPQTFPGRALHQAHTVSHKGARPDIVLIGDSLIQRWPMDTLLAANEGKLVVNVGVGSDRVQNVLWRLDGLRIHMRRTQHVILLVGTNNLTARDPAEAIVAGLTSLAAKLRQRAPRARILVLQIPPRGKNLKSKNTARHQVNDAIVRLCARRRYETMPLDTLLVRGNTSSYDESLLHFSDAGYGILDAAITEWMATPDPFPRKVRKKRRKPALVPAPAEPKMPQTFRGKTRRLVNSVLRKVGLPVLKRASGTHNCRQANDYSPAGLL